MVTCDRCGREFKTSQGLGGHLTLAHRIKPEDLLRVDLSPEQLQRLGISPEQLQILVGGSEQNVQAPVSEGDILGQGVAAMSLVGLSLASSLPTWLVVAALLALAAFGLWLLWQWCQEPKQIPHQGVSPTAN